uniref:Protein kinase domain-containing protein n=1 Tax=Mycena chlorophos TaxID=658473 RepID=A0ABQ0LUN4_MYCCL|nr:predicted protein [Mycena chlorophos]
MTWDRPSDARDLAAHCSQYVVDSDEFSNIEHFASGNTHVVSIASLRGHKGKVALKRWHGAAVSPHERRLFTHRLVTDLGRWRTVQEHPNILPVLGVALHTANLPALVVPFYPTVKDVLANDSDGHIDVLGLLQNVAAGLRFLHSQSPPIAHGDIKASTILVQTYLDPTTGQAKQRALISDIGMASIPQPPDWSFHGVDDARWLAPEVMDPALRPTLQDTKFQDPSPTITLSVTPESDVFSFGMLAFEMYTRDRPYSSTIWSAAVVIRVCSGLRPSRADYTRIPDDMWAVMECCWQHSWRLRPNIETVDAWLDVISQTRKFCAV